MGYFYFDESIHPRGGFALGAFVYSELSIAEPVKRALLDSGIVPGVEEFKSGSRMDRHPEQGLARGLLRGIFRKYCQVGIVVLPNSCRRELGMESAAALRKIVFANDFQTDSHEVYFDKGTFPSEQAGQMATSGFEEFQRCRFYFEQDSVQIGGLQVADLLAHSCAMMLLTELGLLKKTVKAGERLGFDDLEVTLDFELNAELRHHFFASAVPASPRSDLDFWVDVGSKGLHVSSTCDENLRYAAISRFGRMFLGCIH